MYRGVKTPRGPMCQGVETPWCPIYRGVAKLDPLNIQNSPKYRTGESKLLVSYVPGSQDSPVSYVPGVKTHKYFVSQNSPVSYVLGS